MNYKKYKDRKNLNDADLARLCGISRQGMSKRLKSGYTEIIEREGLIIFLNPTTGVKLYSEVKDD